MGECHTIDRPIRAMSLTRRIKERRRRSGVVVSWAPTVDSLEGLFTDARDAAPQMIEDVSTMSYLAQPSSGSLQFVRSIYAVLLGLVYLASASVALGDPPINGLTDAEKRGGWRAIFDGKTTAGWRNYKKESISDGWGVEQGALTRKGRGAGDIVSESQYDNFELSLEYKISPGGNSGIMFHVTEDANRPWHTGPEIQIQDNVKGHDPQLSGWLYQLYKPNWAKRFEKQVGRTSPEIVDATRPAGQWNHVYLRVCKDQSEVVVNGVSYYYFHKGSDDWNKRVAASKFSKFPKFGKNEKGHICLQDHGNQVAYRNIKVREIAADGSVANPIDQQLKLKSAVAFPNVKWANWDTGEETGRIRPLRPMVLTYSDKSDKRVFVAMQGGDIHVLPFDDNATKSKVYLDLRSKVMPWSSKNEEGLLGFAFHPKFKQNGECFVYYSSKEKPRTSIVSRFRVSKDDPDRADPQEEVVMVIPQPYANHNGGSIAFGPDGYLYIGLGDGGGRNDPLGHGQNLGSWMGSILRIDVDKSSKRNRYSIPTGNPFAGKPGVKPEIFAYGFRNIWRLSFDRKTGDLWAADVGQDLWEEINIVQAGGNYGWSIREAAYGFNNNKPNTGAKPLEPIWEYDHRVGKSITGGYVYRGNRLPELQGCYLYADYVSGRIWALKIDSKTGRAVANYGLRENGLPVLAFGEDQNGEVYYFVAALNGQCIYRFEPESP